MNIACGEYRIEYYTADNRLIVAESVGSLGVAKQQAAEHCHRADIAASSYAVMRCVLRCVDGVEVW